MKIALNIVAAVAVILIVLVMVITVFAENLIRKGIESAGSSALGVEVELAEADLSILGGKLTLSGLRIANPEGFTTDLLFEMETISVTIHPSDLFQDEPTIESIVLESPSLTIEKSDLGTNMAVLNASLQGDAEEKRPEPEVEGLEEEGEGQQGPSIKLLKVTGAKVIFVAFSKSAEPHIVPLPDLELHNMSGGQGGGMMMSQIQMIQAALED